MYKRKAEICLASNSTGKVLHVKRYSGQDGNIMADVVTKDHVANVIRHIKQATVIITIDLIE